MPKLLVVFESDIESAATIAESAAAAARGVRFTEVDIRSLGASAGRIPALESPAAARDYDGIVLVAPKLEGSPALNGFLTELSIETDTSNTVLAAVGPGAPALLAQCAGHAAIIVTERATGDHATNAKLTGTRAAKVAGWVRHALGHEAESHHEHEQTHKHDHHH